MQTKRRLLPDRCGRIAVLLALSPMMMLNASQALTLCVGHDGRVAVELVVQGRCACEVPTTDVESTAVDTASHLEEGADASCTDLAIPVGACGSRSAPATSKVAAAGPGTALPLLPPAALDAIESTGLAPPPAFICHCTPLSSIILRV
ncbi:MAG: hypothetical protein EHM24_27535 [Acidobacteria bacterium]|nr:MAG: hypothetical protein EHM24_27535 [Acidobacteriota bacterium]